MGDYNMIYFWTLTFPLATMLSVAMAAYLNMKTKYMLCRLKYDKEFRGSVKGRRFIARMKKWERRLECFKYKNLDNIEDIEIIEK